MLSVPIEGVVPLMPLTRQLYEAVGAVVHRRRRLHLLHSALEVTVAGERFVSEMVPGPQIGRDPRAGGPVGLRWLGRFRVFRSWPQSTSMPLRPQRAS